ncbi:hypothetical protein MMC25_007731 [Agyrium rufum]|nr:hypothetical protein [Agyrium rufum]
MASASTKPPPDAEQEESLKSALWYSIGKIVDQETFNLNATASPQFIGALTELVWTQIENTAIDLESFAKHAGRTSIASDDVLLLARRNEGLKEVLTALLDKIESGRKGEEREATTKKTKGKGKGKGKDNAIGRTPR